VTCFWVAVQHFVRRECQLHFSNRRFVFCEDTQSSRGGCECNRVVLGSALVSLTRAAPRPPQPSLNSTAHLQTDELRAQLMTSALSPESAEPDAVRALALDLDLDLSLTRSLALSFALALAFALDLDLAFNLSHLRLHSHSLTRTITNVIAHTRTHLHSGTRIRTALALPITTSSSRVFTLHHHHHHYHFTPSTHSLIHLRTYLLARSLAQSASHCAHSTSPSLSLLPDTVGPSRTGGLTLLPRPQPRLFRRRRLVRRWLAKQHQRERR
jgi:hypothetical protein